MRFRSIFLCFCLWLLPAASGQQSPVLEALKQELSRSFLTLKAQPTPAYFLSYEITESNSVVITSQFGTLSGNNESRRRQLDIDLRVGDRTLDNTRQIRGGFPDFSDRFSFIEIPVEDNLDAIRGVVWYHTDRKFKRAVEQFTKVKTNTQVKVAQEDKSADFSEEPPSTYSEAVVPLKLDRRQWEQKIKRYTAPFARYGDI